MVAVIWLALERKSSGSPSFLTAIGAALKKYLHIGFSRMKTLHDYG